MIEAVDVSPGLDTVTSLAPEDGSVGTLPGHLFIKFAPVWIFVTGGTTAIFEVEGQDLIGAASQAGFVAVGARHGSVSSLEWEAGTAMFRDGVGSAVPILDGVAILAAILVGSSGKLIVVGVLVAV